MAYNVRWFSEFADEGTFGMPREYRVEVLDRDYTGDPVKVLSGGNPFKAKMESVDDPFKPTRALEFNMEWISQLNSDFEISDVFITDDLRYRIKLLIFNSDGGTTPLFYGYLTPINCEEPFNTKPYPVTLAATCGLPFLKDYYYLDAFGSFVEGEHSLIKIIANCLASTGHDLPIHTYINLFEQSMPVDAQSALQLAIINADGLRGMKAIDVLSGILTTFRAFVVQSEGAWVIKSLKDQIGFLGRVRKYNSNGDFVEYAQVPQSASFGRYPFSVNAPNLRPIGSVTESIAEQNSIVTNNVAPGIAVNRLSNGTFSGPVLSGHVSGWVDQFGALRHPVAAGWSRSGSGRPGDPYKIDITGADTYNSAGVPSNIHIPAPIEIKTGNWDTIKNRDSKIKFVISGAFRAADISWFKLYIRLNDGDKKFASFLDASGKWTSQKKKQEIFAQIDVDVPANPPASSDFAEAALQTFSITTDRVTDFLQRDGMSVAKLYFEVRAGYVTTDLSKFHYLNPRLTWEDFSIVVTTETVLEGEHSYRVDAKFPIRNPNEASFKTIVADKININTPEQNRPENRVLTGYMTMLDGQLTQAWRRYPAGVLDPSDLVYEPIQKKALRETLRLMCGHRRIIEGDFKGYGLLPHHSVFNRYDTLAAPENFFTVTAWEWDVKKMVYGASFHELDFSPLTNEDIQIVGEEGGARGNRLYAGAGGGSQAGGGGVASQTPEEIVVDDIDRIIYNVTEADFGPKTCDIGSLIVSNHFPKELECKIISYPSWINSISVYRGEDILEVDQPVNGILQIKWMGKPTQVGNFQIVIELVAADGPDCLVVIPLLVLPKTVTIAALLDKTSGAAVVVGDIPGLYFVPDISDIATRFKGTHNEVRFSLVGGGPAGNSINENRTININYPVEDFTYEMFGQEGGKVLPVGSYTFTGESYFEGAFRSSEIIKFTLYDEEYLSKASFELWDNTNNVIIGVINPDGSSIFKKPVSFEIKVILTDLENDKTDFSLLGSGVEIFARDFTQAAVEDITYELFGEIKPFGADSYELRMNNELAGNPVYQRSITFGIQAEPPKPEPGIDLIVFKQNTVNYDVVENLPLVGLQLDLPDNYGFVIPVPVGVDYNAADWKMYDKTNGPLVNYDIELRTGVPQSRIYLEGQEKEEIFLFGLKNSTDFPGLHRAPSSLRVVATFRKDGEVVAIRQGEVSFRVPLEPGDYSGVRFIVSTDDLPLIIDTNMPKAGGQYLLPESGNYSVSVREIDGLLFNKVVVRFAKKFGDNYVEGHMLAPDAVLVFVSPAEINETPGEYSAALTGWPGADGRTLTGPDGIDFIIDAVGAYRATFVFSLDDELVGIKETEFEIIDGTPEDLPIEDCCGSSGSADIPEYENVAGQYGDEFKTLKMTVTKNGTISEIEEVDIKIPGDEITGLVHNFDYAPKIIASSTDLDAAATVGQILQYASSGSYDRAPVKTVAVSNISLSGIQTINGYTGSTGSRILATGQTDAKQNGAYVMASGAWARATDSDTGDELVGAAYFIESGNESGTTWKVTNPAPITIGTTLITIIKTRSNTSDLRWIGLPAESADLNLVRKGGVKSWAGSTINTPFGPGGTVLTFVGNTDTGDGNSNQSWINQILAGTNSEFYLRQSFNDWNTWTPSYKIWSEKHFSAADIARWNLAYGWGNHANAGYLLTANFLSTFNSVVPKGDIVAGSSKITLSGSGIGRLIGTGNLTINVGALSIYDITNLPGLLNAKADVTTTNDLQAQINGKSNIGHTHALADLTGAADIQAIELLSGNGVPKKLGEGSWQIGLLSIYDIDGLPGTLNAKADKTTTNDLQSQINGKAGLSVTNDLQSQINSLSAGGMTGGGTAGFLTKFSANKVLTNSIVSENGSLISVAGNVAAGNFESNAAPSNINVNGFNFSNAGSLRWAVGKYGVEDTGNVGSDLYFSRLNNAGGFLGTAMIISRATGIVSIFNQVNVQTGSTVAPFAVNSSVLVSNLNADLLDGQHGSYYLNRANHTGQISIYDVTNLPGLLNAKADTTVTNDLQSQINGKANTSHTHALSAITGASDVNAIELLTGVGIPKRTDDNTWTLGLISIYDVTDLAGILNSKASTDTTNAITAALNGKASVSVTNDLQSQINGKANASHTHPLSQIYDAYDLTVIENLTGSGVLRRNGDSNWSVGQIGTGDVLNLNGILNGKADTSVTNDLQAQINNRATISTTNDLQNQINGKIGTDKYIIINGGLQYLNNNPNFAVGTVTGSGSGNYLARYTSNGTNIGNSRIYDSGSGLIGFGAGFNVEGLVNVSGYFAAIGIKSFADLQIDGNSVFQGNVTVNARINTKRLRLGGMSEATMQALTDAAGGDVVYVDSGTGLGYWGYFPGTGWRIIATRVWVGGNTGTAP